MTGNSRRNTFGPTKVAETMLMLQGKRFPRSSNIRSFLHMTDEELYIRMGTRGKWLGASLQQFEASFLGGRTNQYLAFPGGQTMNPAGNIGWVVPFRMTIVQVLCFKDDAVNNPSFEIHKNAAGSVLSFQIGAGNKLGRSNVANVDVEDGDVLGAYINGTANVASWILISLRRRGLVV